MIYQILSLSLVVLTLTHCSGDVEFDVANVAPSDAAKQLNIAVGKVDLTKICSTAQVVVDSGQTVQGKLDCSLLEVPFCSDEVRGDCLLKASDNVHTLVTTATLKAANIRKGVQMAGVTGTLEPSAQYTDCAADGEVNCIATPAFKAVEIAAIARSDLKQGKSIAGVSGSLANCAADGATGCVAVDGFKAADMNRVVPGSILSGVTIAGQRGNIAIPSACAADGAVGCVTTAAYKAAKVANIGTNDLKNGKTIAGIRGALGECTIDGATGCVATAAYKSAKVTNIATSDLKYGTTIAGISGALRDCSADGQASCVATGAYKAADMRRVVAANIRDTITIAGQEGSFTGPATCAEDGDVGCVTTEEYKAAKVANIIPSDLKSTKKIAGVTGSLATCSTDLAIGCLTDATYKSLDPSHIDPGAILSGTTIAGVEGSLAECTTDGQSSACVIGTGYAAILTANLHEQNIKTGVSIGGIEGKFPSDRYKLAGAGTAAALTSTNIGSRATTSATTEFWDAEGQRRTFEGTDLLQPDNIKAGVTIFGTLGTVTAPTAPSAWDVRAGKTINAVGGKLPTSCGSAMCRGETIFKDVSVDSAGEETTCLYGDDESTKKCMYQDQITGLLWTDELRDSDSHESARKHCQNLTHGGVGDWSLPTAAEASEMLSHGMVTSTGRLKGATTKFWTLTEGFTAATALSGDYYVYGKFDAAEVRLGEEGGQHGLSTFKTICVRRP